MHIPAREHQTQSAYWGPHASEDIIQQFVTFLGSEIIENSIRPLYFDSFTGEHAFKVPCSIY